MMIIGLTGGIGSGKSTVADLFSDLGVAIIDTDIIARELVEPGKPAYQAIVAHFGEQILTAQQQIDRPALRQKILDNDAERIALQDILHPLILESVEMQLQQLKEDYCIVVIPLLVETGRYTMLDRILVVDTPVAEQISRISKRDNADKASIEKLLSIQASREERLAAATDVISNVEGLEELRIKTQQMHDKYMNLCNKTAKPRSS